LKDLELDQVDDFQEMFLTKMRAFHQDDVLTPLSNGALDAYITEIIESEAKMIVRGLQ
jgi:hypothetical protein